MVNQYYMVTEDAAGNGILWVRGAAINIGGQGVTQWGFHSKHPSVEQARAVRESLLYDMDNPS